MARDEQARNDKGKRSMTAAAPAGPVYFLGGVGAAVYFFQGVTTLWGGILAILKAFVWPALLVYQAFHTFHM
jgi:hypothetical protein